MVDMSHYEKETNLSKTRELVEYCNQRQIATEAEHGRIEGGEDCAMDTAGLKACMTTQDELEDFISAGVDTLAPAFGNVHGEYGPQGPNLDFERFENIRSHTQERVRLAVHGTNRFAPELVQRCVAAGATKINVNRLVLDGYYDHLQENVCGTSHTVLIEEGIQKVVEPTVKWMEICGSADKA